MGGRSTGVVRSLHGAGAGRLRVLLRFTLQCPRDQDFIFQYETLFSTLKQHRKTNISKFLLLRGSPNPSTWEV